MKITVGSFATYLVYCRLRAGVESLDRGPDSPLEGERFLRYCKESDIKD